MKNAFAWLGMALITVLIIFLLGVMFVPSMRLMMNEYMFGMTRIDEETDYTNRKMVEDSARAMIANYEYAKADAETYAMFCITATYDKDKCQRSLDAKTSANKTVATYNNYILKNRYLWKNNLPTDIYMNLVPIQ